MAAGVLNPAISELRRRDQRSQTDKADILARRKTRGDGYRCAMRALNRINIRQGHHQPRRIKLDRALRHDVREDRVALPARMVKYQRLVWVDDEIMGNAGHAEITGEFG